MYKVIIIMPDGQKTVREFKDLGNAKFMADFARNDLGASALVIWEA